MGISIYFLTVTYLLTVDFDIMCCKKTTMHKTLQINSCFLTGSVVFNAKVTIRLLDNS